MFYCDFRQKGDGSSAPGAAGEADDVFETHHHTSRHHHRHHKTKVRHNQTPSTESEEARVASEGNYICVCIIK